MSTSEQIPSHPVEQGRLSFNDTEIAFSNKSNADLKRAYWLFKIISSNFLTSVGPPIANFALKIGLPVKGLIRNTIFKHFCGGETIEGCQQAIENLSRSGVGTILDYSVEGEESEAAFNDTLAELIRTVRYAHAHPESVPFSVFKVTGLGRFDLLAKIDANEKLSPDEQTEYDRVIGRVDQICKLCHALKVKVLIDAEHSWIQRSIDDIAREMMALYNKEEVIVYNTYQLYRHDKLADLQNDFGIAKAQGFYLGAKLVRGAYMEIERERAAEKGYPSPIQPDKAASDRDYNLGMAFCLDHLESVGFMAGTHNEESSQWLVDQINRRKIERNHPHIFFAQLLGMSDNLTFNLAAHGYNSAKYMPYGPVKAVMPYLFRRAQENTSVAGQTSRELILLTQELKRRKSAR